jgi:opacity protein-like surface antigen
VIFISSFYLNAQTIKNYGVKFGIAASNPMWEVGSRSMSGVQTKYGIDFGIFADWALSNKLFITSELHFVQKGLKAEFGNADSISNSDYPSISYLSIPIALKYTLNDYEVEPYILIGPRIDFAISKKETNWSTYVYKNTKDVDFGMNIGVGVQTKALLGIGTGLEVRYCPSFTKVDSSIQGDIKNRTYEINLFIYR